MRKAENQFLNFLQRSSQHDHKKKIRSNLLLQKTYWYVPNAAVQTIPPFSANLLEEPAVSNHLSCPGKTLDTKVASAAASAGF